MSSKLNIVSLQSSEELKETEYDFCEIQHVSALKELVRVMIEKDFDLVLLPKMFKEYEKLDKIYHNFGTPFAKKKLTEKILGGIDWDSSWDLEQLCQEKQDVIFSHQVFRENQKIKFTQSKLTNFTNTIVQTSKDLFITEVKSYFKKNLAVKRCHWVAVKDISSKLPPILKLKQELENQKVDQGSLIAEIDNCTTELVHTKEFQIWKTFQGNYMVFLWIVGEHQESQCIVLNQVKIKSQIEFTHFLESLMPFLSRRWSLCGMVSDAQSQIYKDSLTDLYNQRFLTEVVDKKIEEFRRYKTPFSVLFIDVDFFKKVNDSLGHVIGSGVLVKLGEVLKEQIRNSDYAFRYGGDEFIILLSHTEGQDAYNVAERIRETVEGQTFEVDGVGVNITVSIGLAFYPTHANSAEEIIRIADEAMYYGKHKSRNVVYKAS